MIFHIHINVHLVIINHDIIFLYIQDIPKLSLNQNKSSTHLNNKKNKNSKMLKSKTNRSPTPNKDKVIYIKQQFKNNIINLSRYKLCVS